MQAWISTSELSIYRPDLAANPPPHPSFDESVRIVELEKKLAEATAKLVDFDELRASVSRAEADLKHLVKSWRFVDRDKIAENETLLLRGRVAVLEADKRDLQEQGDAKDEYTRQLLSDLVEARTKLHDTEKALFEMESALKARVDMLVSQLTAAMKRIEKLEDEQENAASPPSPSPEPDYEHIDTEEPSSSS